MLAVPFFILRGSLSGQFPALWQEGSGERVEENNSFVLSVYLQ
jgi:hypothetical protein